MISKITHLLLGFKRLVSVLFGPNLTHVNPKSYDFGTFSRISNYTLLICRVYGNRGFGTF